MLVFRRFSSKKKRRTGGRIPSGSVDAALFAAQGVSCLRPRRGDCAGEKRTLLPVTSPVYAAFRANLPRNGVNLPRIGGRGSLGSAVGDGSHLTRRCARRGPREHGDERHPRHCHHRNRRHHRRHKAHQVHKATFFPVRLFLHQTACSSTIIRGALSRKRDEKQMLLRWMWRRVPYLW